MLVMGRFVEEGSFSVPLITFGRRWEQQTVILCGSLDKEPLVEDVLYLGRQTR